METAEQDFYEALKAIGGCEHVAAEGGGILVQSLDKICKACRITITKLVLLRDHYRTDEQFFR